MRSLRDRWSRSSMRLTDAVTIVSGRRTTSAPDPTAVSTSPIRDRARSAWLTVGRLAPNRSARSRSGGSRAPSAMSSLMMRRGSARRDRRTAASRRAARSGAARRDPPAPPCRRVVGRLGHRVLPARQGGLTRPRHESRTRPPARRPVSPVARRARDRTTQVISAGRLRTRLRRASAQGVAQGVGAGRQRRASAQGVTQGVSAGRQRTSSPARWCSAGHASPEAKSLGRLMTHVRQPSRDARAGGAPPQRPGRGLSRVSFQDRHVVPHIDLRNTA